MTRKLSMPVVLLVLVMSAFSYGAFAQTKIKNYSQQYDSHLAKQKVLKHVKKSAGGNVDVFGIKEVNSNAGKFWRVKFLKDGKIQYMDVAPQSATD